MKKTKVLTIRDGESHIDAVREAAEAIQAGKLVGFPTETVYGIAALATNRETMQRLRDLKARPEAPFSVHLASGGYTAKYIKDMPLRANWLMERAWPGPATLLVQTGGSFADDSLNQVDGLFEALTMNGVIGLRCPDEIFTQQMLSMVDGPVVAPSANLKGKPSPRNAEDVLIQLDGQIDLLIDTGETKYGNDSSIVMFDDDSWKIIRQGVFNTAMLDRMMTRRIAFVCTGNTCRSPMAEGIGKRILAERHNCPVADLPKLGIEVISAGVMAFDGCEATDEAVDAAAEMGADISTHRSQTLTAELLKTCDLVFCMTQSHLTEAQRQSRCVPPMITLLDKNGIPDPIGGGPEIYKATAQAIESAIMKHVREGRL